MPLTGIRVLDLTRLLPGAFCTMLLADMGADVIKVEEPGTGDYMRWMPPLIEGQSVLFNALNRNKRSLTLNLKSEAGRELLLRLVDGSDVLVEGNRPGVMERLGVGWAVIHARNPALIMCSITGYGQDGPMAARAGHDINYVATAGVLGLNGSRGEPPSPLAVQVGDVGGGGLQPAVAILGALVGVPRGVEGRWLDVTMTGSAVSWLALALATEGAGAEFGRGGQARGSDAGRVALSRCPGPGRAHGRHPRRGGLGCGHGRCPEEGRGRLVDQQLPPDRGDLFTSLVQRSAVVDHVVGAAPLLLDRQLRADHRVRVLAREAAT